MNARAMRSIRGGFTALELGLACVLLALALVPVLRMETGTTAHGGFSTGHLIAQERALALLEAGAAAGLAALQERAARGEPLVAAEPAAPESGVVIESAELAFEPLTEGLGCLSVEVTWRAAGESRRHRVRHFRMITRPDLGWLELSGGQGGPA